jgi:hypothetical protein
VPTTVFSDSDAAIALAIRAELPEPGTVHLLCTWHLSLNFNTNIRSLFVGEAGARRWNVVKGKFWVLAKDSEKQGISKFDEKFGELVSIVQSSGSSASAVDSAVKWLTNTLYAKRMQWAACFTWQQGKNKMCTHVFQFLMSTRGVDRNTRGAFYPANRELARCVQTLPHCEHSRHATSGGAH